jgi:voltage-gated potassium channel
MSVAVVRSRRKSKSEPAAPVGPLRARLHALYHGQSKAAVRFRYGVIVVDLLIIAFFIANPFLRESRIFLPADYAVAAILVVDMVARVLARSSWAAWLKRPETWLDLFVLGTLLFPQSLVNLGFLRVMRLWTLFNSEFFWRTVGRRYDDTRVEEVTKAVAALVTFVFVMTGFVYGFVGRTQGMHGYVDALYFTVASLTTTGYGDVVLPGPWGRLLSIVTMLAGITLFIRLAQPLFRPRVMRRACQNCGLQRHETDARHCKACGTVLPEAEEEE